MTIFRFLYGGGEDQVSMELGEYDHIPAPEARLSPLQRRACAATRSRSGFFGH